jgi:hypothetical protein
MRLGLWLVLLAALAAGQDLIANPDFKENARGWMLRRASVVEEGVVRLAAAEGRKWTHAGVHVTPVLGRELDFRCRAKATGDGHSITVNTFAYGESGRDPLGMKSLREPLRKGEWVEVRGTLVVPPGTKRLALWIVNLNPAPVLVSGAHLVVGRENATPNMQRGGGGLNGPGVLRASAGTMARTAKEGDEGVVTFPIPAKTPHQVPLTFDVKAEPAAALKTFRWRLREDGRNWLCDITLAPTSSGASVRWEALVLVGQREDAPLPRAAKPQVPEEAAAWLRSTACVQSADPAIVAKANELAEGTDGVEAYVKKAIAFTSSNRGKPGVRFDALDARKALDCGGSCTSRANLCAALLRARGIPARTQAHLPAWSGPLYEHWLVEYWHPGAGWTWVESTLGQYRPQPWTLVVLNVANPADEDLGFNHKIRYSGVMVGVPLWSVHNIAPPLLRHFEPKKRVGNVASVEAALKGTGEEISAAFAAARTAFERLAAGARKGELDRDAAARVEEALKKKSAVALRDALAPR